mmetsp:Transcript_16201/g.14129  ORF Transcript_16201/g.14129 Transcript_16201/m.14129 type:complete len:108 (+) Transcript_16201:8-331(+)
MKFSCTNWTLLTGIKIIVRYDVGIMLINLMVFLISTAVASPLIYIPILVRAFLCIGPKQFFSMLVWRNDYSVKMVKIKFFINSVFLVFQLMADIAILIGKYINLIKT